jgi:predicted DNA-binding transcriptional regulator YafY
MAITKLAAARYLAINRCLRSKAKKHWSAQELVDRILEEKDIRVTVRTIWNDIEVMRYNDQLKYFAPIDYCKINKGYYYTDPDYSIDGLRLSDEQWKSFETVMNFLQEHRDLQVMKDFYSAVDKLSGVMSQFRDPDASSFLEFEKAPYYKGLELRDQLLEAIQKKKALVIRYTTFGRSFPMKHTIHPYLLKEYKNRWYLIGLLHSRQKIITLALDRIDQFSESETAFQVNTYVNIKDYFANFLGVTYTEGVVEEVVLRVTPFLANYLKTQHIHGSHEVMHEDSQGLTLRLKLIPNHELMAVMLSHGKDIKVLSPQSLRDQVVVNLKAALNQYE